MPKTILEDFLAVIPDFPSTSCTRFLCKSKLALNVTGVLPGYFNAFTSKEKIPFTKALFPALVCDQKKSPNAHCDAFGFYLDLLKHGI